MMNEKRWEMVRKFEDEYRRRYLKNLTEKESLEIFKDLYQFAQMLVDKNFYKRLNEAKIKTLSKVHSYYMKVKL